MNVYPLLIVTGIVFVIVALMHLLRLIYKSEVVIAGKVIPMWVSKVGFIIPLVLAIWVFVTIASL